MAPKRRREDDDDDDDDDSRSKRPSTAATIGQQTSSIKNKVVRSETYNKLRIKKKKEKKAERQKRQKEHDKAIEQGLEPPPKQEPRTIENTREADVTMVADGDAEVAADEEQDEFAEHFQNLRPPKVLITTSYKPSGIMYHFLSEMLELLPCAQYYKRAGYPLKKIVQFATNREYTDVLVFNEDRRTINAMLHVHLPDGPTAQYRLSSLVLGRDIKGHGRATAHKPELVLNNFGTRLGRRVGRMFASLFCQDPNFKGRRVVTFHNQRDFVFVRHHRYIFEEREKQVAKGKKAARVIARLQELGPRFTLKLVSLQKGTFDTKHGEFEWVKKKDADGACRRRFAL